MPDYYKILGINKDASQEDIKKAFRTAAIKHHPDKGGDKEKFQEIQEAHEILSNPQKRAEYDNPTNQSHFNFPFEFKMNQFFKRHDPMHDNTPPKANDHQYNFSITLKDVFNGLIKRFKIKLTNLCKTCNTTCNDCKGNGFISHQLQHGPFIQISKQQCQKCSGKGLIYNKSNCQSRNACTNGVFTDEKLVEIIIPRGVEEGKKYIFNGWGEQPTMLNQAPGNLIVTISITPDKTFSRNGLDLIFTENITLKDSIVGKILHIPHFSGPLELDTKGFGIINPHKQYTVFNKGIKTESGKIGNLHIRFDINYPNKTLDDKQIAQLCQAFTTCGL